MNAVEILALILAIMVLLKLVTFLIKPNAWFNFAKGMTKHVHWMTFIYVVLAVIVGYYVFSAFTVVQVGAVTLFASLLFGIAWIPHMKKLLKNKKDFTKDILHRYWLAFLIWIVFAIWIIVSLFI